jgi:hypothetical protein
MSLTTMTQPDGTTSAAGLATKTAELWLKEYVERETVLQKLKMRQQLYVRIIPLSAYFQLLRNGPRIATFSVSGLVVPTWLRTRFV